MQYKEVRRYRTRDESRPSSVYSYGSDTPKVAEDAALIVRDLVVRVDTLLDARRDVVVSLDGDYLVLGTRIPAPAPVAAAPFSVTGTSVTGGATPTARKPAERARATKKVSRV